MADLTLSRNWLDGFVNACMHSLSFSGIIHQGGRAVAECGPLARNMWGVGGLSVFITQYSGLSACLPMLTVTFWCSGISSKAVTTIFAASSARSLPLVFVRPLIVCNIVGRFRLILYLIEVTLAAISGLWWWYSV